MWKDRGSGVAVWMLVLCLALWTVLIFQLRIDWSVNEQYGYGWFVPFLALYLFWKAWPGRPLRDAQTAGWGVIGVVWLLLFLWLPVRLVQEANPEWRPVSWMLALLTVGVTWCALYLWGGGKWLRYFAFATGFILVAIPWPTPIEHPLVQGLMSVVARLSVELLMWIGIPAHASGNVIELPGRVVGVDEACSGVRSLQTVIMAGLFLGELYRMNARRRVTLVGFGLVLALVVNVFRTTMLASILSSGGLDSLERRHDAIGYVALGILLAGLLAGAAWLQRSNPRSMTLFGYDGDWSRHPHAGMRPQMGEVLALQGGDFTRGVRMVCLLGLLWLAVVEVAVESWYRSHESRAVENARWSVVMPQQSERFQTIPLNKQVLGMLRANEVDAATWRERDGYSMAVYFLRWTPGRNAAQLARLHRPEVCLPAVGCVLRSDEGVVNVKAKGLILPFHSQVFVQGKTELTVFYCLWEDRVAQVKPEAEDWSVRSRWRAVLEGRRHLGQQVLEVIMTGPGDYPKAVEKLQQLVGEIVRQ